MVALPEKLMADIVRAERAVVVLETRRGDKSQVGLAHVGCDDMAAIGLLERGKFGLLGHLFLRSKRELDLRDDLPKFDVKKEP